MARPRARRPEEGELVALPWKYNLADGETFPVYVYRDHSEWSRHDRWFHMPPALLQELFVDAFACDCPEHLDWLERQYPGHQFVY